MADPAYLAAKSGLHCRASPISTNAKHLKYEMSPILQCIFPEENAIPDAFRIEHPIEQREYLIDGALKTWTGNLNPIVSPVCVKDGDQVKQRVIGSTPLLTSKESLEALDAAVKAYDLG